VGEKTGAVKPGALGLSNKKQRLPTGASRYLGMGPMMAGDSVTTKKGFYPFNAEQTVNILGEFGPLVTMFIVNALYGVQIGTWALIVSSVLALIMTLVVLGRPPVFPFIAGAVTIGFGVMTLVTGDPKWVQIKVTIFNALFAVVLWIGLAMGRNFFHFVFGKTFHYTTEGWRKFTHAFAGFFVFTAVANEAVRLGFQDVVLTVFDKSFDGVQIWILFKLFVIMPIAGLFGWWQTKKLFKYKLPEPTLASVTDVSSGLGPVQQAREPALALQPLITSDRAKTALKAGGARSP
jgi:intracellular septation protein